MTVLLLAPAVAVVGHPATFTLLFPGGASADTKVRLSDNGAGGGFLPAVVKAGAGEDQVFIYYTPARDGPIQISTDPPATWCLPMPGIPVPRFVAVSSDGGSITLNLPPPPYRFLHVESGVGFRRGTYEIRQIDNAFLQLDRPCTTGAVNITDLNAVLLMVAYTGAFTLQAQHFWPCQRTGGSIFTQPETLTVINTGKRSNIFNLGEPITLRARKGTVVTTFTIKNLEGDVVAAGPLNPSEFYDASVTVHIDRCGYYLVDYFAEANDPVYGMCAASAPLVVLQHSTTGLMERPAYSSIYGDFKATATKTALDFVQWIAPPGSAEVPWYAVATGQVASRVTGVYAFRISCPAGASRLAIGGRLLLDCMNDPTYGSSVISDPIQLLAGRRLDIAYECSGIATAYRPTIEMSLDAGHSWHPLLIDQYPTATAEHPTGLTIDYLSPHFDFQPRAGFDLFTDLACGLGLERLGINNVSNPGPETAAWERLIDARLSAQSDLRRTARRNLFIQFTPYRCTSPLIRPALVGTRDISMGRPIFGVGGILRIGDEMHEISSAEGNSVTLQTELAKSYPTGTLVRNDPASEDAGVTATVRRLREKVYIWEGTNEPDQYRSAIEHVVHMRSFYAAVKAGAPGLTSIVIGPTTTSANHELDPGGYVDILVKHGGLAFVDGFSFHAYNLVDGEYLQACKAISKIRSFLAAHGASALPLYQTEQGYQTDLFGVFEPSHQVNWLLAQRFAFDEGGLPLERDYFWTTRDHGDPAFATHLITTFSLLTPAWLLLRTYSDALADMVFLEHYPLGSAEGLFVASRYSGTDKMVAVFWSPGNPDATLDLEVTGNDSLEVRDGWDNRSTIRVRDGRASLTKLGVPTYVTLKPHQQVRPVLQSWGPNLARMANEVRVDQSGADASAVRNGRVEFSYFDGSVPFTGVGTPTSGTELPLVLSINWLQLQHISRIVIRCPAPWQLRGTLQQYDIQSLGANGLWQTAVPLVTRLPRSEAILQPGFNATVRDFWTRQHVFHHALDAPTTTTSLRVRIFAASWGGEACQLGVEAGGQGDCRVLPQISEWQVYGS